MKQTLIHLRADGKLICGAPATALGVNPRTAKFVTCKRCLAKLAKF